MKETRATNTSLPKGKEAMVLIGEMWSKLPVGRRRPVRSFVQRHRCRTANETFTRPHRKRKRAPIKIGQRSPGKNTNKNSPRTTPTRKLRQKPTLHRPPRDPPRKSAESLKTALRKRRSAFQCQTKSRPRLSPVYVPHRKRSPKKNQRIKRERPYGRIAEPSKNCQCYL